MVPRSTKHYGLTEQADVCEEMALLTKLKDHGVSKLKGRESYEEVRSVERPCAHHVHYTWTHTTVGQTRLQLRIANANDKYQEHKS